MSSIRDILPASLRVDLWKWGRDFSRDAVNFVYPPCCLWCREELKTDSGQLLCVQCANSIAPPIPHRCEQCSAPVGPYVNTEEGCVHCQRDRLTFRSAISLGVYDQELRRACARCKHSHQRPLTTALSSLLCDKEAALLREWKIDVVVPVPHHWIDRLLVTDHAADALADQIARFLLVPVDRHILVKRQRTRKQRDLTATERRSHLRGVFRVAPRTQLTGLRILLTDDVMTTGTTVNRASQALIAAGAEAVFIAVLARTVGI